MKPGQCFAKAWRERLRATDQTAQHRRLLLFWIMPICLLLVSYMLGHRARFMLGDSESYLRSGIRGYYPPDRSWIYGVLAREAISETHSLQTYILLQLAGVFAFGVLARRQLGRGRRSLPTAILLAGLACDPLIQTYARFYLSDLSAALLFATFAVLLAGLVAGSRSTAVWVALFLFGAGAVLFRIAYAPIEMLTLILCLGRSLLDRARRPRHALMTDHAQANGLVIMTGLLVPLLGVSFLVAANHVVFQRLYPGELFVNRFSGTFLMGVFSPAITAPDIRSAGIDLSDTEYGKMRITKYDLRNDQIWGSEPYWLRSIILARLHASGFDSRADRAASKIVRAALRRDPMAFARIYATGLLLYAEPTEWTRHLSTEMGEDRPLSGAFVALINEWVPHALAPSSAMHRSFWPQALGRTVILYPPLLLACLLSTAWLLLTTRDVTTMVISAAFVADVLTVPLYSNYVIPRYVLAAVLLGWCLLWLACAGTTKASVLK